MAQVKDKDFFININLVVFYLALLVIKVILDYLSEDTQKETNESWWIYVIWVLNDNYEHFHESYQLCHASDILDYLDKKVKQKFDEDCALCVYKQCKYDR